MFIDGLDHNAVMRPVRSVNGLGCRTCMKNGTGAKLYTLPHLVNHFRTAHVESPQMLGYSQAPELDWKHVMIDYPDLSVISKLLNANGMTDAKLGLIAFAFPDAFPTSLPSLKSRANMGPHPTYRQELDVDARGVCEVPSNLLAALPSQYVDQSGDQSFDRPRSAFRALSPGRSSEPPEPPREDEYDPHRPAYLGKIVKFDGGFTQPHKAVPHSSLQNGHRYMSYAQQERSAMPPRLGDEQPNSGASALPRKINDSHFQESYEPFGSVTKPQSPMLDAVPWSGHHVHQHTGIQAKPPGPDNVVEHYGSVDFLKDDNGTLENERLVESLTTGKRGARGVSPPEAIDAADRFLSTLAPEREDARPHKRVSSDRDMERNSQAAWMNGPPFKRRQQYVGHDCASDQRSGDDVSVNRNENDVMAGNPRVAIPPNQRNDGQVVIPQRSGSYTHFYDDLPPLSRAPLKSVRVDSSPPVRYAPYEDSEPVVLNDRQDVNGSVLKRPRSGSHTYQVSSISRYRDQSASPQRPPMETALYQPRTPVEEDRRDGAYQVRSPSSRRLNPSKRVPSYEYPTRARYEYIDDPGFSNSHYPQRVEYVPIRYEEAGLRESARYVITRPVEQMGADYVRYEPGYATEPVYERHGQVYNTSQRAYQDPYSMEAPSFAQSRQY